MTVAYEDVEKAVGRALQARTSAPALEADDVPEIVLKKLQEARVRLDTAEASLIWMTSARSKMRYEFAAVRAEANDAWAQASVRVASKHGGDYSGAKERQAEADLATMEQRAKARTAERDLQRVEDAWLIARMCKDSLDRLRQDLLAHMRSFTLEDNLSR